MPMKLAFPYWSLLAFFMVAWLVIFTNYWWNVPVRWSVFSWPSMKKDGGDNFYLYVGDREESSYRWGVLKKWWWISK